MAITRFENHPVTVSYSANGSINLELSPKPYTITRMAIMLDLTVDTAASLTNFNDPWDRVVSRLALTGAGRTFFDFDSMRTLYHLTRFRGHGLKRPTVIAASQTGVNRSFGYRLHFGICPRKLNPATGCVDDNPYDLSAGIPPVSSGNLTLTGSFAAAAAPGTGYTVTGGQLRVYLWGVQPEAGDPVEAWMPRAFPAWTKRTPTPTATSGLFATQDNVPAGDFLHAMMLMTTNGTNDPRADDVLGGVMVYNQAENREVWKAQDFQDAAQIVQAGINGWPPSDDGTTLGAPAIVQVNDAGLLYLPLHQQVSGGGHPLYGVDLRNVSTGDLQLRYEVLDATGVALHVAYTKYALNPAHPLNAG